MKNFKSLLFIGICFLMTLTLQAQRQGGANLDTTIKGHNVGLAIEQAAQTTFKWIQTGDKSWTCTNVNTGIGEGVYTETHRDEWSVYLTRNSKKYRIDLWQKRVYDLTRETASDILSVALRPTTPDVVTNVVSIENRWKPGQFISLDNTKMYGNQPTTFKIEKVDNTWFRLLDMASGKYLNFEKEQLNSGNIQPGWWSAQFKKVPTEDGYFRLVCRMKGSIYNLHIEHGKLECSRLGDIGWWSAQWKFKASSASNPNPNPNPNPVPTPVTGGKVTFNNIDIDGQGIIIEVFKETGAREPEFVGRLPSRKTIEVDCNIGDTFSFIVDIEGDFEALPVTVGQFGVTHNIIVGERFANSNFRNNRIPNADASRHSFDIFKIDPIYIDYTGDDDILNKKGDVIGNGGMRKQIFKSLNGRDIDWTAYDGDFALKNQFGLKVLGELEESEETKLYYNASSFKNSFTANIGISGGGNETFDETDTGFEKNVSPSGGGSASFGYFTSESNSQTELYTYTRAEGKIYDIILQEEHVQLTEDFKSAIMNLPKPSTTPQSLAAAKKTNGFNSYKSFIRTWGTHYPVKASYGGIKVGVYTFTEQQFKESEGWNIDLKGEAEKSVKIEGGGSYSQEKSFEEMSSNAKKMFRYKGGGGAGEGWAVDMDNSQAIGVDLKRLHELVTAYYFKDGTQDSDLADRKVMLKYALEEYIGAATDLGKSLKPRFFKIYDVQWKMINEEDGGTDPAIYGSIKISVRKVSEGAKISAGFTELEVGYVEEDSRSVFQRSDTPGGRVIAPKGHTEKCPGELVFSVPASDGEVNVSPYYFVLDADLSDYDQSSGNDLIGSKMTEKYFKDISNSPQTIKLELRSDDGDIDVTAKVKEINLGFDDF